MEHLQYSYCTGTPYCLYRSWCRYRDAGGASNDNYVCAIEMYDNLREEVKQSIRERKDIRPYIDGKGPSPKAHALPARHIFRAMKGADDPFGEN